MVHGWFLKSVDPYLRTFNFSLLTGDLFKCVSWEGTHCLERSALVNGDRQCGEVEGGAVHYREGGTSEAGLPSSIPCLACSAWSQTLSPECLLWTPRWPPGSQFDPQIALCCPHLAKQAMPQFICRAWPTAPRTLLPGI